MIDMAAFKSKKEPVRIRQKSLSNGNKSLYLDIYLNGRRRYEFLKMYLIPEHSRADREKNKETLRLAEAVKSLRVVENQNGRYGFNPQFKMEIRLLDYYDRCTEGRDKPDSHRNKQNWICARRYLTQHFRADTTFAVMMIDLGADIYTVQKLLGHADLKTTEIYAKLLDKKKQAAVAKIPDLL